MASTRCMLKFYKRAKGTDASVKIKNRYLY